MWSRPHGVLNMMAVPFVVASIGKITLAMTSSGMKAASSMTTRSAVKPLSEAPSGPHGKAVIWLPLVSWIWVRVDFTTDFRRTGCFMMRFSIIPNIIMLCLKPRLTMRVVVFGFVKAKWITLTAMAVVLPVCRAQQATMRLLVHVRS